MKKLLDLGFTKFLSLTIIKIWWVIALVLIIIFTVGTLIGGLMMYGENPDDISALLVGIGAIPFGLLLVVLTRLFLEGVVVLFRIADNTSKIAASSQPQPELYPPSAVDAMGIGMAAGRAQPTDQVPPRHGY